MISEPVSSSSANYIAPHFPLLPKSGSKQSIANKNLKRRRRKKIGFSEMEMRCKWHPNEIQQPGICSSCLREKLSLVSSSAASFYASKNTNNTVFCSSYSSPSYSSVFSSPSTPRRHHGGGGHRRNGSDVLGTASFMLSRGDLKKSKSICFVRRGGGGEGGDGVRKRGGFWKKLLKNTGRRTKEILMSSRSLRGDRVGL